MTATAQVVCRIGCVFVFSGNARRHPYIVSSRGVPRRVRREPSTNRHGPRSTQPREQLFASPNVSSRFEPHSHGDEHESNGEHAPQYDVRDQLCPSATSIRTNEKAGRQ